MPNNRHPLTTERLVIGQVSVCCGCCGRTDRGKPEVPVEWLKAEWRRRELRKNIQLSICGCLGPCDCANVVKVDTADGSIWLGKIDRFEQYREIVDWATRGKTAGRVLPIPGGFGKHRLDPFRYTRRLASLIDDRISLMADMPKSDQRKTRQRAAIRETFERAGRPLSPQQVLDAARTDVEGLGIATVYRNIKGLLEDGWLSAVNLPGAVTVYERAGKPHHHHFHCDGCSRVFELTGCVPSIDRLAGRRFSVRRHELVIYGLCAECKAG